MCEGCMGKKERVKLIDTGLRNYICSLQFQQMKKAQITIAKHLRCFLVRCFKSYFEIFV